MEKVLFPHILLPKAPDQIRYVNPKRGRGLNIKEQNRESHGIYLRKALNEAWNNAQTDFAVYKAKRNGLYLEFKGEDGYDVAINSLESLRSKKQESNIRLLNVRYENNTKFATVYVPIDKKDFFFNKIEKYLTENTPNNLPKNQKLLNNINDIKNALTIEAFWQDANKLIPKDEQEWCEVWVSSTDRDIKTRFDNLLIAREIKFQEGFIDFPERSVKLILANKSNLLDLICLSDDIAEIRKAKDTAAFFTDLPPREQSDWVKNLQDRIVINPKNNVSVCIFDTGINRGHPLLSPILALDDCLSNKQEWGTEDHHGHGTLMAGIAGYGDLMKCLLSSNQITLNHILESVKILPKNEKTPPELWGFITSQAVSMAEINAPNRKRIHCLAVTAEDTRDQGRPSSWSGSLDQITSGATEEEKPKRLFILSGGNIPINADINNYPFTQFNESIHDPAQAWNVITVGACTDLTEIKNKIFDGYRPIALKGYISPFTTTSRLWGTEWPIKPEVVMEGGNAAVTRGGITENDCSDLSLLSTYYKPLERLFDHFNMTSASAAQASFFAAKIQSEYPKFWPETIRGLIVHSAEWTEELKKQLMNGETKKSKREMVRTCGYGIPKLEQALYSANNNLTLIAQTLITPYSKTGTDIRPSIMHLYDLPWPKSALLSLPGSIKINMRVTLSYFIEPSPGEIGWKNRYAYASHSLRFYLKTPTESRSEFEKRVNKAAREENEINQKTSSETDHWFLGEMIRNKGSIHSDIWTGTAQQLAESNIIAIVPGGGWWKERTKMEKWKNETRYSLIVSIFTPDLSVDIYTPVINQLKVPIQIPV